MSSTSTSARRINCWMTSRMVITTAIGTISKPARGTLVARRTLETTSAIVGAPITPRAALFASIASRHHHAALLIRMRDAMDGVPSVLPVSVGEQQILT
jgi:hypothetical protein